MASYFAIAQPKAKKDQAQLFKGTAELKFEDAQIYFRFSGDVDNLLKNIGEAHKTEIETFKKEDELSEYKALKLGFPAWLYGNYNIYISVLEDEKNPLVTIYHTYYRKTQNITGSTLGANMEKDLLAFYQKIINKSK